MADDSRIGDAPSAEVRAAFGDGPAPDVDTRALHDESGRKLGLGSSAAGLVASLGARALARGDDLGAPEVRARIFRAAREAHARAQEGGSGVDVAASVHGGVLRYTAAVDGGAAAVRALALPLDLEWVAYDSGKSARTSEMRARVDAFRPKAGATSHFAALGELASAACTALEEGDARSFVRTAQAFGSALGALGRAADVAIVPPAFAELASAAARENAAFLPSGAGGGDVAVWLGTAPPSAAFAARAAAISMRRLALSLDRAGVRRHPPAEASSP